MFLGRGFWCAGWFALKLTCEANGRGVGRQRRGHQVNLRPHVHLHARRGENVALRRRGAVKAVRGGEFGGAAVGAPRARHARLPRGEPPHHGGRHRGGHGLGAAVGAAQHGPIALPIVEHKTTTRARVRGEQVQRGVVELRRFHGGVVGCKAPTVSAPVVGALRRVGHVASLPSGRVARAGVGDERKHGEVGGVVGDGVGKEGSKVRVAQHVHQRIEGSHVPRAIPRVHPTHLEERHLNGGRARLRERHRAIVKRGERRKGHVLVTGVPMRRPDGAREVKRRRHTGEKQCRTHISSDARPI